MRKYNFGRQTHKMIIVLVMVLCNYLLYKSGIAQKNTYDMRYLLHRCRKSNTYQLLTLISNARHPN